MFSFFTSIIGYMFGIRIIKLYINQIGWMDERRKVFFFVHSMLVCFIYFLFGSSPLVNWCVLMFWLLFLLGLPRILGHWVRRKFKESLMGLIDEMILTMQSGVSFRGALASLIQKESNLIKVQLLEIQNRIHFTGSVEAQPPISDPEIQRLTHELQEIDRSRSKSLDQLKSFRRLLRIEKQFQEKESQINSAVRAQMGILSALFAVLLAYVTHRFGFDANRSVIILAVSLFFIGLGLLQLMGRKKNWRV